MDSKDLKNNKNEKFLKYWEHKRKDKKNYAIKNAVIFSFVFSCIISIINSGFSNIFFKTFPIYFFICSILFGLYVYFIEFNVQEKRYQKILKENNNLDNK